MKHQHIGVSLSTPLCQGPTSHQHITSSRRRCERIYFTHLPRCIIGPLRGHVPLLSISSKTEIFWYKLTSRQHKSGIKVCRTTKELGLAQHRTQSLCSLTLFESRRLPFPQELLKTPMLCQCQEVALTMVGTSGSLTGS
jgi:hypothetical protein